MADKTVKTRIQIKRETESNWNTASTSTTPFKPLSGELIYYTDKKLLKVGDGTNTPKNLPVLADGCTKDYVSTEIGKLKFAGASTQGGAASSAAKLTNTTEIGNSTTPVYFNSSGVPVACGTLFYAASSTAGGAADKAKALVNAEGNLAQVGSETNPVYITSQGVPAATNIPWAKMADGGASGCRPAHAANRIIKGASDTADNSVGDANKPVYIDRDGIPRAVEGLTVSTTGNANTATKLQYETDINVTGAVSATGIRFDGSPKVTNGTPSRNAANIEISGLKEAYLTWGGKNFVDNYGPIDAAVISTLGANRFAFLKPAGVTIQYSRDAGATWSNYTAASDTSYSKALFGVGNNGIRIGKYADNEAGATANGANYLVRVTIKSDDAQIYSELRKFAIYISTNGSSNCWCTIEAAQKSAPTTWKTFAGQVPISGWSGWNIINTNPICTYSNNNSQYQYIRFTFGANGGDTNHQGMQIMQIQAFGGVGWTTPSNMASTGHIYSYDNDQNVLFPGAVTATQGFNGNATTATALANTNVGSATTPVYFVNGRPVASNKIPTIHTGSALPSDSLGSDGDLYVMPYARTLPAIYSGTTVPDHSIGVNGDIYILYE